MFTIAHISDIHFGRVDPRIADALAIELNAQPPDLLVISGDLTQRARARQFKEARSFLSRLPQPQLIVPGNHDVPLWDFLRRIFSPLGRFKHFITPELSPVFVHKDVLVAGLCTARRFSWRWRGFWKDGGISARQREDVARLISGSKATLKVIVTHHPVIPAPAQDPHEIAHGSAAALGAFAAAGADLLLAGHLHLSYRGVVAHSEARSMLSIQAGSAASTRLRGQPNAYNRIIHDRDGLQLEVRSWNGQAFVATESARFARVGGRWHEQP